MPFNIKITDGGLGFIMEGKGIITGQELIDGVYERFSTEEKIKKYIYGMSDYTDITENQIKADAVKLVAEKDKQVSNLNPNLVIAITAPKDVMYGLSRMFAVHAEKTGWNISVFRTLKEAKTWIKEQIKIKYVQDFEINFEES